MLIGLLQPLEERVIPFLILVALPEMLTHLQSGLKKLEIKSFL